MMMMKKPANHKPSKKLNKQLMLVSVKYTAEQIVSEKEKNNASKLLKEGSETFPKMSMRTINKYITKLGKERVDKYR
jgi:hypothetical protein